MTFPTGDREPSLLDASCEAFVHDLAALTPTNATEWGIPGFEGELEDYSPDYWSSVADRVRDMLADVDAFDDCTDDNDDEDDFDAVDCVTAEVLRDRLRLQLDMHHELEFHRQLNNLASPVQTIRDTFLLMDKQDTEAISSRLSKVKHSLHGYRESLALAAGNGRVSAIRQVDEVADQCRKLAGAGSMLDTLGISPNAPELNEAKEAFNVMAEWLSEHLASHAPHDDAVGRERYERFSHEFVGARVDLDEAYEWGLEQLREINAEQESIAAELYGAGTSVEEARQRLNDDEKYLIEGVEKLQWWMQETADKTIADLGALHFDIPEAVRTIECCIDPAGTGGIFYTPPSDDFARPGRMWWSVPEGETRFHTWQELTTVFHEGVPGHHLQIGQALCEDLNLWRRSACWISGHGEGWALYAEQLMDELGYHEDPGTRMGLLDAQRMRAARVAIDIGVHLGKTVPEGTGTWDGSYARMFMRDNSDLPTPILNFEINRYLGWPGQAPSYALGQRLWQDLRTEATAAGMELRDFHSRALSQGSIPMNILRQVVLST